MFHQFSKGGGDIYVEVDPGGEFALQEIRLHLAANGGANSFTTTRISQHGEEYNVVLNTQDMSSAADEVYIPTRPQKFSNGDTLLLEWTNASSIIWGLEIVWS